MFAIKLSCPFFTEGNEKREVTSMLRQKYVAHQLKIVMNKVNRYAEASMPPEVKEEVTERQGRVLGYLHRNQDQDIFQKDVEAAFCITRSTASKMLSAMEESGLITRSGVTGDARLKKLALTEKALVHIQLLQTGMQGFEQTLTRGMTEEDKDTLLRLLGMIEHNVETAWSSLQNGKE